MERKVDLGWVVGKIDDMVEEKVNEIAQWDIFSKEVKNAFLNAIFKKIEKDYEVKVIIKKRGIKNNEPDD